MKGMETLNNKVACTPFEKRSVEIENKSAFATVKSKVDLVPLTVVLPAEASLHSLFLTFEPTDTVWVKGESIKLAWSGEVYEVGGKRFILVPVESILLREKV